MSEIKHDRFPVIIIADDDTHNYFGWATKARHSLEALEVWEVVKGDDTARPIVPERIQDPDNFPAVLAGQRRLATWTKKNNLAKSKIINACPDQKLHVIEHRESAAEMWSALDKHFLPEKRRAQLLKSKMESYRCTEEMDVAIWVDDMRKLRSEVLKLHKELQSDRDFGELLLRKLPKSLLWMQFVTAMETTYAARLERNLPYPDSDEVTSDIRAQWDRLHDSDDEVNAKVFTAKFKAEAKLGKRPIGDTSATDDFSSKRPRISSDANVSVASGSRPQRSYNLKCENTYCTRPNGHVKSQCFAYGGGECGRYPDWWAGPKDLHLPPNQRSTRTNKQGPPSKQINSKPRANQVDVAADESSTSRAAPELSSADSEVTSNAVMSELTEHLAWHVFVPTLDNYPTQPVCEVPILNLAIIKSNACNHDSGANMNIFHDRNAFEEYREIHPLKVSAFGDNLTTIAIGIGKVKCHGWLNDENSKRTITLSHAIHIPAARTNLISQIQLDKVGVSAFLGDGRVELFVNKIPVVGGRVVNGMYRLNLEPIMNYGTPQTSAATLPSSSSPDFCTASWGT